MPGSTYYKPGTTGTGLGTRDTAGNKVGEAPRVVCEMGNKHDTEIITDGYYGVKEEERKMCDREHRETHLRGYISFLELLYKVPQMV